MGGRYNEADINAKTLETWRGDDFALFNYPPRRWEQVAGVNDTTRLVLDFKNAVPAAIEYVSNRAIAAFARNLVRIRDEFSCRYIAVAPTSQAGETNVGCEAVAAALAGCHAFLTHEPAALERSTSLTPSHLGGAHTVEDHVNSIRYVGPTRALDLSSKLCSSCRKAFRTESGLGWHLEHVHGVVPGAASSYLLIDDVITHGRTGDGCRQVLIHATGTPRVIGFYVAKTNGW